MRKIQLIIDLETEELTNSIKLAQKAAHVIKSMFFVSCEVLKVEVKELPHE